MTGAKAAGRTSQLLGPSGEIEMLRRLIDWPELARLGWDPERQVFAPAADDPVLGLVECRTAGCEGRQGHQPLGALLPVPGPVATVGTGDDPRGVLRDRARTQGWLGPGAVRGVPDPRP